MKGPLCLVGLATACSPTSRSISSSFTLGSSLLAFLCFLSFSFFSLFSFSYFLGLGYLGLGNSVRPGVIHPPTASMLGYVFSYPPASATSWSHNPRGNNSETGS